MGAPKTSVNERILAFTKLPRSQWVDYFLNVPINDLELDVLQKEIEILKPKVKDMLLSSQACHATSREFIIIHLLLNLGLAYHFDNEIEIILLNSFIKMEDMTADENNLYTVSIMFCLFRTYGHNISSDVFKRFKEDDGRFKECLREDVLGMLSFYEASHLRTGTDKILDEALSFTSSYLESVASAEDTPPHIAKLIKSTLYLPQRWNMEAIVAKEYISFYEHEEDHDKMLLKLAKLNFKYLQLHYNKELKELFKWWKELDQTYILPPQFRERIVEAWLSAAVMCFEPQFSVGRIITAKLYYLLTIFDDACDNHFSHPELLRLVECVERWNRDDLDKLEDVMRTVFQFLTDVFDGIEREMSHEGSYHLKEMLEELKIIARANLKLDKWARGNDVPDFDEYVDVGAIGLTSYGTIAASFVGMGEIAGKEAYEWLRSRPKIIKSVAAKGRLMDDITDYERDMNTGFAANAINYYMKQYGATKEEADLELQKMVSDINKTVNEEILSTTSVPRRVLMQALNLGRLVDSFYIMSHDVFNCREGKLKEYIITLLVDQISL